MLVGFTACQYSFYARVILYICFLQAMVSSQLITIMSLTNCSPVSYRRHHSAKKKSVYSRHCKIYSTRSLRNKEVLVITSLYHQVTLTEQNPDSLTISPHHPSQQVGLLGWISCLHRADVNKFLPVGQHWCVHV